LGAILGGKYFFWRAQKAGGPSLNPRYIIIFIFGGMKEKQLCFDGRGWGPVVLFNGTNKTDAHSARVRSVAKSKTHKCLKLSLLKFDNETVRLVNIDKKIKRS
jgi:hypothetical protein